MERDRDGHGVAGHGAAGHGVAAALDPDGLRRLAAGRELLTRLNAAYEAADAVEERRRAVLAMLPGGLGEHGPAEDGAAGMLGLILGMMDGSLRSSPLFDVSAVASGLD